MSELEFRVGDIVEAQVWGKWKLGTVEKVDRRAGESLPYCVRLDRTGSDFWCGESEVRSPAPAEPISSPYVVRDSGEREQRGNGFVRDSEAGKPDLTPYMRIKDLHLIPAHWIEELAEHLRQGSEKYGDFNWQLASGEDDRQRFLRSHARHAFQFQQGDRVENHACAEFFNAMAAKDIENQLRAEGS